MYAGVGVGAGDVADDVRGGAWRRSGPASPTTAVSGSDRSTPTGAARRDVDRFAGGGEPASLAARLRSSSLSSPARGGEWLQHTAAYSAHLARSPMPAAASAETAVWASAVGSLGRR